MEDLSIFVGDHKFNFRVSALIRKGEKVLLHHTTSGTQYTLPGGRVKDGETTNEALIREIKEEMGEDVKYIKPVSFIENLFVDNNIHFHELLVTHELEFKNKSTYEKEKIYAIEKGEEDLEFVWKDVNELEKIDFRPKILINVIKENSPEFKHILNVEKK